MFSPRHAARSLVLHVLARAAPIAIAFIVGMLCQSHVLTGRWTLLDKPREARRTDTMMDPGQVLCFIGRGHGQAARVVSWAPDSPIARAVASFDERYQ